MQITVLCGGPSAEREISLISGASVVQGLKSVGHNVFCADIAPDALSALDHPADVIFPVLHGFFGESGELQEILERRGIGFVGSGSRASRLGINKVATKQLWKDHDLPTPPWHVINRSHSRDDRMPAPCVIKPIDSGSSIDVAVCRTQAAADQACERLFARYPQLLVEDLIEGPELTISLLEEEPLDPIRITTTHEFFDFDAKYRDTGTKHDFILSLPHDVIERCRELARQANRIIGARDLARVDLMLDGDLRPYLLEINTMPGFTPTSLLPEAAAHAGIEFGPLVDRLATRAYERAAARPPLASVVQLSASLRTRKPALKTA